MTVIDSTLQNLVTASWVWLRSAEPPVVASPSIAPAPSHPDFDLLAPLRRWLDGVDVRSRDRARWLCQHIPAQCPFERDVVLFGKPLFHIPPLCHLNPLYEELTYLRFRALSYLADECGDDISPYI